MIEWRELPRFDGVYEISSDGRIRRAKNGAGGAYAGQELAGQVDRLGYQRFNLRAPNGELKRISAHISVLEVFVGPRPDKFDASHKNGVKLDNRLENLCWESSSDNHRRKLDHGTLVHSEKHKCSKLTTADVLNIRERLRSGERGLKASLAREYGVSKTLIGWIEKRKAWPHASRLEAA
jgi:hypothetical protein